jgi:Asp-tRNA(Asn)/Glu-tRNA(Gln) amidotransferase A subunit family amidase
LGPRLAADGGAYVELTPAAEVEGVVRRLASDCRRPLGGWPLAVKDLIAIGGKRLTAGSASRMGAPIETDDAPILAALRRLGMVVVGATALHELAFGVTGLNSFTGTPNNPLAPGRVPGGSSSGSAVAVAEGSARIALGTDTGGSVRIPAAFCGVVGYKPSYGRYPTVGVLALSPTLDHVGTLGRSVADLATVHAALGGRLRRQHHPPSIGVIRSELEAADPDVAGRVEMALELLAREGARIAWAAWPDRERVHAASTTIMFAEAARVHREVLECRPETLGSDVRARLEAGLAIDAAALQHAMRERAALCKSVWKSLGDFGCVVGATVSTLPPTLAEAADPAIGAKLVANTRLANLVGIPALSLPICGDGLPVGLQVTAQADAEALVAAQWIERVLFMPRRREREGPR